MLSSTVDRGWRYLRGHKPKAAAPPARDVKPGPVTSTDMRAVVDFVSRGILLNVKQLDEAEQRLDLLERQADDERFRAETLREKVLREFYGLRMVAPDWVEKHGTLLAAMEPLLPVERAGV